jgi:large subunit ribosomal protein L17
MRHRKQEKKIGRSSSHHQALLASLVCHLIKERRIKTTLTKAKLTRSKAEKMVTLARRAAVAENVGDKLHVRRQAISTLRDPAAVKELFEELAPKFEGRQGGYVRVLKLGQRSSDGSEMALVEWVGVEIPDKRKKKAEPKQDAAA